MLIPDKYIAYMLIINNSNQEIETLNPPSQSSYRIYVGCVNGLICLLFTAKRTHFLYVLESCH